MRLLHSLDRTRELSKPVFTRVPWFMNNFMGSRGVSHKESRLYISPKKGRILRYLLKDNRFRICIASMLEHQFRCQACSCFSPCSHCGTAKVVNNCSHIQGMGEIACSMFSSSFFYCMGAIEFSRSSATGGLILVQELADFRNMSCHWSPRNVSSPMFLFHPWVAV